MRATATTISWTVVLVLERWRHVPQVCAFRSPWPSGDTIGISVLSAHRFWNHVGKTEMHSMSKDCCWVFRGTATKSRSQDHRTRATMLVGCFMTAAPNTPDRLRRFSMTGRSLDAATTFEDMCVAFEQAYAQDPTGLLCECCQAAGCESCQHALGWHVCQRDREALGSTLGPLEEPDEKWKAGTLHGDKFDVESNLWVLARRLVPLHVIQSTIGDLHCRMPYRCSRGRPLCPGM